MELQLPGSSDGVDQKNDRCHQEDQSQGEEMGRDQEGEPTGKVLAMQYIFHSPFT